MCHVCFVMNELKQLLVDKLGLTEEQSQQAVEMVLGYVKEKLPENAQGLVDAAAKGEVPDVGGLLDQAKGFFGG